MPVTNTTTPTSAQLLSQLATATIANVNNASSTASLNNTGRNYFARVAIMTAPTNLFRTDITTTALADAMLIYTSEPVEPGQLQPSNLRFIEVLLYMCVKGYDTAVAAGEKNTTERSTLADIISHMPPSGSTINFTSFNAAWNVDKFDLLPQVACKPGVGGLQIGLAAPQGVSGGNVYSVDLCTALMTSSAIVKFLPGFIVLREGDRLVATGQVAGMLLPALGTALYGEFMGRSPGEDEQLVHVRGIVRNIADGLTNM